MGSTILEAIVEFFAYLFASRLEKNEDKRVVLMTRIIGGIFVLFLVFIILASIYNNLKE